MIDFACKQFNVEEVMKCSLGLSKAEFKILLFLCKHEENFSSSAIASELDLDLSTAQRATKKLFEKEIVHRFQENRDGGGYEFTYKIMNRSFIRKKISTIVHSWADHVEVELKNWSKNR